MPNFPGADASSRDISQASPPELGSTGDPPVPVGDPPTGTEQGLLLPSTPCRIWLVHKAKGAEAWPGKTRSNQNMKSQIEPQVVGRVSRPGVIAGTNAVKLGKTRSNQKLPINMPARPSTSVTGPSVIGRVKPGQTKTLPFIPMSLPLSAPDRPKPIPFLSAIGATYL